MLNSISFVYLVCLSCLWTEYLCLVPANSQLRHRRLDSVAIGNENLRGANDGGIQPQNYSIHTKTSSYAASSSSASKTSSTRYHYAQQVIANGTRIEPLLTHTEHNEQEHAADSQNRTSDRKTTILVNGKLVNTALDQASIFNPVIIINGPSNCVTCAPVKKIDVPTDCNQYGCVLKTNGTVASAATVHLYPECDTSKGLLCVPKARCEDGFVIGTDSAGQGHSQRKICDFKTESCCRYRADSVTNVRPLTNAEQVSTAVANQPIEIHESQNRFESNQENGFNVGTESTTNSDTTNKHVTAFEMKLEKLSKRKNEKILLRLKNGRQMLCEPVEVSNNYILVKLAVRGPAVVRFHCGEIRDWKPTIKTLAQLRNDGMRTTRPHLLQTCLALSQSLVICSSRNESQVLAACRTAIRQSRAVAIATVGFMNGRLSAPSLIAFNCDNRALFVFDLFAMEKNKVFLFKNDWFREFLADERICKIAHCARFFIDFLVHNHKVKIGNFFDTAIADRYCDQNCNLTDENKSVVSQDNRFVHPDIPNRPSIDRIHLTTSHVPDTPIEYVFKGNGYLPPIQTVGSESNRNEIYENLVPPQPTVVVEPESNPSEPYVQVETERPVPEPEQSIETLPTECAAALMCVREEFCTKDGYISPTIVTLNQDQKLFRVPLSACFNTTDNVVGKCCRDPNYVDPWPATILGQYDQKLFNQQQQQQQQKIFNQNLVPHGPINQFLNGHEFKQYSSINNVVVAPPKIVPAQQPIVDYNTSFGEIYWQAMVLDESQKRILCGGVIVDAKQVVTTSDCVKRVSVRNIAVKGGEWELGRNSPTESKPFQIRKVQQVVQSSNGVTVLELDHAFDFDRHLNAAQFDASVASEPNLKAAGTDCFVTGWGKEVLQLHLQGAVMHRVPVQLTDNRKCPGIKSHSQCVQPITNFNICDADLGSGLVCGNQRNGYKLKGIYASDNGCGNRNQYAQFIKIDSDWLKQMTLVNKSAAAASDKSTFSYTMFGQAKKRVRKVCTCTEEEILE